MNYTDPSTSALQIDENWIEIADTPGEIYDVIEYKEEWEKDDKFDVESYLNGNTDYWNHRVLILYIIAHII